MIDKSEIDKFTKMYRECRIGLIESIMDNTAISDYARLLVVFYAGQGSGILNSYFRSSKIKEESSPQFFFYTLLNKALDEIGGYNNQIIYRMDNPLVEFETMKLWYRKRIGQVVCFPNFLSTSKERWINNDKIFKIHTSNSSSARDLTQILDEAKADSEKEVLFKSQSKFRVMAVKDDFIELREVSGTTKNFIIIDDDTYFDNSDNYEECEESF
jgi:ADP-ribosyltransferase exoenzyme